jgi:hypothetical protein
MAWKKEECENCGVYVRSPSEVTSFKGMSAYLTFVFEREFGGMGLSMGQCMVLSSGRKNGKWEWESSLRSWNTNGSHLHCDSFPTPDPVFAESGAED